MKITPYKKGDKIAGIYLTTFAGEDMSVASEYNIHADLFDKDKYYLCPNVISDYPGSGMFLDFLENLKAALDKPLVFTAVVNMRVFKYLEAAQIPYLHDGALYNPQVENNPLLKGVSRGRK